MSRREAASYRRVSVSTVQYWIARYRAADEQARASGAWAERLNHRIYNVSTGRLVGYSEVVAAINAAVPGANITLPDDRNPDRPSDHYLDTTRLRADTGFEPRHDVEHVVPDYVDWLRTHDRWCSALAMPALGPRRSSDRARRGVPVFVRVVRFNDVTAERVDSLVARVDESGPPPGVPIKRLQVVFDEAQGTAVVLQYFDSEADLQTGAETFAAMDPSETPGRRVSVDTGELRVDREP